jgi:hypothetical protein
MGTAGAADFTHELALLRSRVRADRRGTSAPLVVFGGAVVVFAVGGLLAGALPAAGRHTLLLLFWPVLTVAALLVLRRNARRRADRTGVGEGRFSYGRLTVGYVVGLLVLVLLVPVLFLGVFAPMVWPAVMLAVIAALQRNRRLGALAAGLAVGGVAELWYVVAHSGGAPDWLWAQSVVYVLAGLAVAVVGLLIRRRERTAP